MTQVYLAVLETLQIGVTGVHTLAARCDRFQAVKNQL
jgi:hypothetical protein